jgi:hypothetical protein
MHPLASLLSNVGKIDDISVMVNFFQRKSASLFTLITIRNIAIRNIAIRNIALATDANSVTDVLPTKLC